MARTSRMLVEYDVERYGPLFDGRASEAVKEWLDATKKEVADIGADWIRIAALGMDKSGRGGTGRAAEGVQLTGAGTSYTISGGVREGEYSWPWLEGTSQRNVGSEFKGYRTFRRTRLRMRKQVTPFAQKRLEQYLEQMGGGEA